MLWPSIPSTSIVIAALVFKFFSHRQRSFSSLCFFKYRIWCKQWKQCGCPRYRGCWAVQYSEAHFRYKRGYARTQTVARWPVFL